MKRRRDIYWFITNVLIIGMLWILLSCEKEKVTEEQDSAVEDELLLSDETSNKSLLKCGRNCTLISYELVNLLPSDAIKAIVGPSFESLIKYGVKMYKVSYQTRYNGCAIVASGVIGIPDMAVDHNTTVVMYNHGTRITEADLLPSGGFDLISVVSTANGKICFAPDYIGFGDSKQIFHPFLIKSESVYPVCDMIIAGKEFLKQEFAIRSKPSITIFGFSQGAIVTMAVQRELEKNPYYRCSVHLNGVAMCAGPYDLHNNSILPLISQEMYSSPSLFLFAFVSYTKYYHVKYDVDKIFKNSYGQLFLDLVAQNKTSSEINAAFPVSISELFQDNFRADFLAGRTPFNYLFKINATYKGWVPKSPTRIYHSPADEIVPYANAEIAYNTFVSTGSKSVELITLPPVSHVNSSFMAFVDIISWADSN